MTEILSAVSPSVFSWSMLGRRSSAAFLLLRPEKGVWWPTSCRTHPVRVAAVALKLTDLVSISRNAATGRATWRHLSSCSEAECENPYLQINWYWLYLLWFGPIVGNARNSLQVNFVQTDSLQQQLEDVWKAGFKDTNLQDGLQMSKEDRCALDKIVWSSTTVITSCRCCGVPTRCV